MSLKAFHIVFIISALALTTGFGTWALRAGEVGMGIGAIVFALGLAIHLTRFVRRTRHLPFICAVCLGDPNSLLTTSANAGVWFLLAVIMLVLIAFAGLFLFWARSSTIKTSCLSPNSSSD